MNAGIRPWPDTSAAARATRHRQAITASAMERRLWQDLAIADEEGRDCVGVSPSRAVASDAATGAVILAARVPSAGADCSPNHLARRAAPTRSFPERSSTEGSQ